MDKDISYRTFYATRLCLIRQFTSNTHFYLVIVRKIFNDLSKLTYCLNFVYSHNLRQLKAPKRILRAQPLFTNPCHLCVAHIYEVVAGLAPA